VTNATAIRTALLVVVAVVLLSPLASAQQEFGDIVQVYVDNEKGYRDIPRVKVTEDSIEGVTYKNQANRSERKAAGEVRNVFYGDAPTEWSRGLSEMASRQYDRAVESFKGAVNAFEAKKCGPWVKEYAAFQTARCRAAQSTMEPKKYLNEALGAIDGFLSEFPNSRLKPDALLVKGDLLLLADRSAEARGVFSDAEALAKGRKLFVRYEFEALLGKARSYAMQKDWTHAITDYQSIEQRAGNEVRFSSSPEAKAYLQDVVLLAAGNQGDALLSKAESTNNSAHFATAKQYFEGLTSRLGDSDRVKAMSGVGVAVCLLAENKAREAMRQLAEVKVAHFSERNEVAKALYYMSKAADKLGYTKQAVIYLKELRELYPDTEWARRAD